jgi:hypothetical protein
MVSAFIALPEILNTLNSDIDRLLRYEPLIASCISAILVLMKLRLAW